MPVGSDARDIILASLAGKSGKEAKAIIEDLSKAYGLSTSHVYRLSENVRASGRAARKDRGKRRLEITDEQLAKVRSLTFNGDVDAATAIELAELNEFIPRGLITSEIYNRWNREDGLSARRRKSDVKPMQRFEASGPNVLHQFDTTKLEELHYDKETDTLSWDPRANRKNSRGEKPDSIWLYLIADDYSRCRFARLYRSLNQYNHLDFLYHAWSEKPKPTEFPFYGLPKNIYMDNGGGNQATTFRTALKKLGVHIVPTDPSYNVPHAARKRGKIERSMRLYNEKWLKRFQFGSLKWDEACESLHQFTLAWNQRESSRTGHAPFARWLEIGTPKHTPQAELWKILHYDHDTRLVYKDLTVSIDRHIYRLPERKCVNWIGERIDVYWSPNDYSKIHAVFRGQDLEVKENIADLVRPAFHYSREEREPTAVESVRAASAAQDLTGMKLYATDPGKMRYLPRKGEKFDEEQIALGGNGAELAAIDESESRLAAVLQKYDYNPRRSVIGAKKYLQEADFFHKPPTDSEAAWLDKLMDGRVEIPERDLDDAMILARARAEDEAPGADPIVNDDNSGPAMQKAVS